MKPKDMHNIATLLTLTAIGRVGAAVAPDHDGWAAKCTADGFSYELQQDVIAGALHRLDICHFGDGKACGTNFYFNGECDASNPDFASYCEEMRGVLKVAETDMTMWDIGFVEHEVCTMSDGTLCGPFDYYNNPSWGPKGCFGDATVTTVAPGSYMPVTTTTAATTPDDTNITSATEATAKATTASTTATSATTTEPTDTNPANQPSSAQSLMCTCWLEILWCAILLFGEGYNMLLSSLL